MHGRWQKSGGDFLNLQALHQSRTAGAAGTRYQILDPDLLLFVTTRSLLWPFTLGMQLCNSVMKMASINQGDCIPRSDRTMTSRYPVQWLDRT